MENTKYPLFKVYYSDGSTYTAYNEDDVAKTPIFEVLVIVEFDKYHGRKLVCGGDFYILEEDNKWTSCDKETKEMYMYRNGLRKRYLIGVMVHHDKWAKIMLNARTDPDFPEQTALHRYESNEGFE